MSQLSKPTILVLMLLVFLVAKVFCCCLIKGGFETLKKTSCSHCASKASSGESSGCCLLKGSPMELASNQYWNTILPMLLLFVVVFVFLMNGRFMNRPYDSRILYLNGPPGPFSLVPFYIQARSIRI